MESEWDEPLTRIYEITFAGRAGTTLRAAFDDCTVIVGPGTTTLRARLPDQAALWGLIQRIISLGLEVVELHLLGALSGPRPDYRGDPGRRAPVTLADPQQVLRVAW